MKKTLLTIALALMISGARAQTYHTIVLDKQTICTVKDATHSTQTFKCTLKILNKNGNDDAQVVIALDKTNNLKNFTYTVSDENGKELRKFKKKDLMRTEYSSNFKTDSYRLFFDYSPSVYPCIISYEYSIDSSDGSLAYPVFQPIDDYEQKVEKASYQITVPQDFILRTYRENTDCTINRNVDAQGSQTLSVEMSNLPVINKEPFCDDFINLTPRVFFAPTVFKHYDTGGNMETWENYSCFQASLYDGRQTLQESIKNHLHELCDELTSPKDKLAKVYEYFGKITRYVSIQLGIGGMQPIEAAEVCRTGYGDCKGLSNLMMSMLKEVGIESNVAIISTDIKQHPKAFPSAHGFNHAILMVPMEKDTIWIECTNPELPLAYVHEDIAGHDALLLKHEGGKLVELPHHKDSNNIEYSQAEIVLKEEGEAHINITQKWLDGYYDDMHFLKNADEKKQKDYLFSSIALMGGTIDSLNVNEKATPFEAPEINLKAIANCRGYATITGRRLIVRINPFHYDMETLREIENRKYDIVRNFGYKDIDDITITLPEGYIIEALPQNVNIDTPFGYLKIDYKLQDGKLKTHAEHYAKQGHFSANQYADFRKFYNQVVNLYQQKLIIVKK